MLTRGQKRKLDGAFNRLTASDELKWLPNVQPLAIQPCDCKSGLKNRPIDLSPLAFFELCFPSSIFDDWSRQTNLHAFRYPDSDNWIETSSTEMRAFLGVLIWMSIIALPEISMYWNKSTYQARIAKVFTRTRFKQLLSHWHLNKEKEERSTRDSAATNHTNADIPDNTDIADNTYIANSTDMDNSYTDIANIGNAENVDNAENADNADNAENVDNAKNADNAENADNADNASNNDVHRFDKLEPLMSTLLNVFKSIYSPGQHVVVDEAMAAFTGRVFGTVYMKDKPDKWGFKFFLLADCETYFISNFQIYVSRPGGKAQKGLTKHAVLNLARPWFGSHRVIYADNYYMSVELCIELLQSGLYASGTTKPNRKYFPRELKNDELSKQGESRFLQCGPIIATRWFDKKDVYFLSTAHTAEISTVVSRRQKTGKRSNIKCPLIVQRYGMLMGAVDRHNQLRNSYRLGRRSKKWWHSPAFFLIGMATTNAYNLYRQYSSEPQLTHCKFLQLLAEKLINNFANRKQSKSQSISTNRHLPDTCTMRQCHYCSHKMHMRKRTTVWCPDCQIALCAVPCFRLFHLASRQD